MNLRDELRAIARLDDDVRDQSWYSGREFGLAALIDELKASAEKRGLEIGFEDLSQAKWTAAELQRRGLHAAVTQSARNSGKPALVVSWDDQWEARITGTPDYVVGDVSGDWVIRELR